MFRKTLEEIPDLEPLDKTPQLNELDRLIHSSEINLIKKLSYWPNIIMNAAKAHEPHRIVYFLQDLSNLFHSQWNLGNQDKRLRFLISDDIVLTKARLNLCMATANVIFSGLKILGVDAVKEMR